MFLDGGKNMPPVLRSPDEVGAKEEGAWALMGIFKFPRLIQGDNESLSV